MEQKDAHMLTHSNTFTHLRRVGAHVDDGLVLDVFSAVCILKRVQTLVVVHIGRAGARNHDGLAVAAQRVLQQPRELAVAKRDVAFGALFVSQGANDIA